LGIFYKVSLKRAYVDGNLTIRATILSYICKSIKPDRFEQHKVYEAFNKGLLPAGCRNTRQKIIGEKIGTSLAGWNPKQKCLTSSDRLWLEDAPDITTFTSAPRIGIDYAGDIWKNIPWRFTFDTNQASPPPNPMGTGGNM